MAKIKSPSKENAVLYLLISILIIVLNMLECCSIYRKVWKTNFHTLLGSLAVADFLLGSETLVYALWVQFSKESTDGFEEFDGGKLAFMLIVYFSIASSALHIEVIVVDRFLAVAFPIKHRIWMTVGRMKKIVATTWLLSLSLLTFLGEPVVREFVEAENGTIAAFGWFTDSMNRLATMMSIFAVNFVLSYVSIAVMSSRRVSINKRILLNEHAQKKETCRFGKRQCKEDFKTRAISMKDNNEEVKSNAESDKIETELCHQASNSSSIFDVETRIVVPSLEGANSPSAITIETEWQRGRVSPLPEDVCNPMDHDKPYTSQFDKPIPPKRPSDCRLKHLLSSIQLHHPDISDAYSRVLHSLKDQRTMYTCALFILAFVGCNFPLVYFVLIKNESRHDSLLIGEIMLLGNSALNPVLYYFRGFLKQKLAAQHAKSVANFLGTLERSRER